jgi:hypothetical protein
MNPSNPFDLSTQFKIGQLNECNNNEINAIIVSRHEITEYDYSRMVLNHFGRLDVPTKSFLMSSFNIGSVTDCEKYCIQFNLDIIHPNTNDGILMALDECKPDNRFSVQLFKGLLRIYEIDRLEVSKASNIKDGDPTLAFKAYCGQYLAYHGNFATRYPNVI